MRLTRYLTALITVATLLLGQVGGAAAQTSSNGDSYAFTKFDATVEVASGSDLSFGDPFGDSSDPYEGVEIAVPDGFALVVAFPAGGSAKTAVNQFLDGFTSESASSETVKEESGRDIAWRLVRHDLGGRDVVTLFYVDTTMAADRQTGFLLSVPEESFLDTLSTMQQDVTVDGTPAFENIDSATIEDSLGGGSTATPTAETTTSSRRKTPTPEPTTSSRRKTPTPTAESRTSSRRTTPTPDATEASDQETGDPRDNALIDNTGTDQNGNESQTGNGTSSESTPEVADPAALKAAGLKSETSYVSPAFGTRVKFDGDTWVADPENPETAISDTSKDIDTLRLEWTNGHSLLWIDSFEASRYTPADYVEHWQSQDYLDKNASKDAEILDASSTDTRGAVVMRDFLDSGDEIIVIHEFIANDADNTGIIITFVAYTEEAEQAYSDAVDNITVNREPVMDVFTVRELRKLIA